jgi:hypothetical protein
MNSRSRESLGKVSFGNNLAHQSGVIHVGARLRAGPDGAVDGFSRQGVVAARIRFPGDAFGRNFNAEGGERDDQLRKRAIVDSETFMLDPTW